MARCDRSAQSPEQFATLRLVARYADACNLFSSGVDEVAHKLDVLRGHCHTEGRDPATVDKTILAIGDPLSDVDGFLAEMEAYAKLGIAQVDVVPVGDPVGFIERVGHQLVPRLASIEPAT